MKDDYLWDKSGEADAEIEELEKTLGRLRYRPRPLSLPQTQPRRTNYLLIAAAVALIALVAGVVFFLNSRRGETILPPQIAEDRLLPDRSETPPRQSEPPPVRDEPTVKRPRKAPLRQRTVSTRNTVATGLSQVEIGKHIESSQLLLRDFRNIEESERDLFYEKRRSRRLLEQNAFLRRNAEARGNAPVGGVLGQLEPFLLDIANLSDRPSSEEVAAIRQRIEKKDIIATLQIYSTVSINY